MLLRVNDAGQTVHPNPLTMPVIAPLPSKLPLNMKSPTVVSKNSTTLSATPPVLLVPKTAAVSTAHGDPRSAAPATSPLTASVSDGFRGPTPLPTLVTSTVPVQLPVMPTQTVTAALSL